ncbi:aldo/keto reductase [Dictyobacter formicarum]|uniref:Aldo/keto reductase n=1 Tax=Dictyobacter formicarum TaxID=2778368 RepID=A0ABQ3VLK2_9CHLR|nr:aldo/keto reductase [Dictyobacter formicarum]GHO86483.1 aldo/keto reductase [Dictyobacter formicarum]
MHYRTLGRTGWNTSEVGFGSWGIGGDAWGQTDDSVALAALHKAIDEGVNFIDTADVYGNGHSEQLVAQVRKERSEPLFIATKAGRRLNPHVASGYNNLQNLRGFVERSLRNLDVEALDLLQLHCPPSEVYDIPEVFGHLDTLVQEGKLKNYGVSVEKVEEALKAIQYPNVKTVQIIFNIFRLKPAEAFFAAARERNVGIIVRVPLASGLLTGKFKSDTQFDAKDHRNYNRHGESFDQGETFSGVDYETGLQAVEELRDLVPEGTTLAQFALRWILMFPEVSTVIPGAKNPDQATSNTRASNLAPLSDDTMRRIQELYDRRIRAQVHSRW